MSTAPEFEETRDHQGAYLRLSDDAFAALADQGTRRTTAAGELLFRDGYEGYDFFVVLSGQVAIMADIRPAAGARHRRARGAAFPRRAESPDRRGRLPHWPCVEPGEVIQISADRLTQIVPGQAGLGDLISGTQQGRPDPRNSAGQAAVFLARHSRQVMLMVRRDGLAETMSRYLIDQLERTPNIEVRP